MITRKILQVIFISIFLVSVSNGSESDRVENLKAVLAFEVQGPIARDVGRKLSKSGIAQSDIDRIVEELSNFSASCIVDALVQHSEERFLDTEQILLDAEAAILDNGSDDFVDALDKVSLKQSMEYCVLLALENAGALDP